jgi:hypothetical protein
MADNTCMHCQAPLGDGHRAVKYFTPGGSGCRYGRACRKCWGKTLCGSLLYSASLCKRPVCDCGWCAEWLALQK